MTQLINREPPEVVAVYLTDPDDGALAHAVEGGLLPAYGFQVDREANPDLDAMRDAVADWLAAQGFGAAGE